MMMILDIVINNYSDIVGGCITSGSGDSDLIEL